MWRYCLVLTLLCALRLRRPLFPSCFRVHSGEFSKLPPGMTQNGNVVCYDHAWVDLKRGKQMSEISPGSTSLPPSRYLYRERIEDLVVPGLTKYEVFCARAGRILRRLNPRLTTAVHIKSDPTKNSFIFYSSNDLQMVELPIGAELPLKAGRKEAALGMGGLRFVWRKLTQDPTVMSFDDWRLFHRVGLNIDCPITDANGVPVKKDPNRCKILQTDDHFYAYTDPSD